MPPERVGLFAGIGAYLLWGLFPLYWPLLDAAAPVEILAHRIAWSLVFLVVVLAFTAGTGWIAALERRQLGLLALAAALITVNWGLFIYGVNSGHVVETSLGYFINPLVTVGLAVALLGERLSRAQGWAVAIAAVAVAVLTLEYGRLPYIALTLACSFGLYGLVKKRANVGGTQSIAIETALLVVPAVAYLLWLGAQGRGTFLSEGPGHAALLAGAGIATAVPLMLFGAATIRIPLITVGLLQYIAPVLQFAIGVLLYEEPMPIERLAGFALVWLALAVFTVDAARTARAARPDRPAASRVGDPALLAPRS